MAPKNTIEARRDELKKLIRQERRTIETLEDEITSQKRYIRRNTNLKELGVTGEQARKDYLEDLFDEDADIKQNRTLLTQHEDQLRAYEDERSAIDYAQRERQSDINEELNKNLSQLNAWLDNFSGSVKSFEDGTKRLEAAIGKLVKK